MSEQQMWYYAKNDQQLGPISLASMQEMARSGSLGPEDLIWTEGLTQWMPAHSVPAIFPSTQAPIHPQSPDIAPPPGAQPLPYGQLNYYTPQNFVQYAGFWHRFAAAFIDGIIVSVASWIILIPMALLTMPTNPGRGATSDIIPALAMNAISILIRWLYEALLTASSWQGTVGKLALGIKVVDQNGDRISFARSTGRYFAKIPSGLILGIGFIMAAFTEKKQGLHDMMAGTFVVRK